MNDRDVSGFLSLLLRHHPEALNITIDKNGWTDVETLVSAMSKNSEFTVEDLERIVRNDNKTRYMFNSDHTLVRAIYGHSLPVTIEYDDLIPPEFLWHGSSRKSTERILQEGLTPQRRNFVHLSYDMETAKKSAVATESLFCTRYTQKKCTATVSASSALKILSGLQTVYLRNISK